MMKRNYLRKIIGCFLAGTMLATTLVGCGDGAQKETETQVVSKETETTAVSESETQAVVAEGFTYPLDTDETLTIAIVNDKAISAVCKDITETSFWKGLIERTGVNLEATVVENNNAMSLLLASGELPDVIWWRPANYSGGATQMIADKVLEPMTMEEMEKWAPDLLAYMESEDYVRKCNTIDSGEIIGFPLVYGDEYLQSSGGIMARADWLKELNMEVPDTPDEFLNMLRAFKNEKGATVPYVCYSTDLATLGNYGFISTAFGLVNTKLYQVDGTVHAGFSEPEYKDVLTFIKQMYDEGLVAKDFYTLESSAVKAYMYDGTSGAFYGAVGSGMGTYLNEMAEVDPKWDLVAIPSLTSGNGETPMFGAMQDMVHVFSAFITPACENKELAMKFLNYAYSEEGNMYYNFGIEGESYTMVDGYPTYTEWITNNPDGLSMQQALAQYVRAWGTGPYVVRKEYFEQYAGLPQQKAAIDTWAATDCLKYMMPRYTFTVDESAEYSKISADIDTYVNEMFIKFVTGEVSLDAFETEYIPALEKMGLKRYLEILQGAVDRFNAR